MALDYNLRPYEKSRAENSSAFLVAAMIFLVNRYDINITWLIIRKCHPFVNPFSEIYTIFQGL